MKTMKTIMLLFLAVAVSGSAQPRQSAKFREHTSARPKSALVDSTDRVFADIVTGGGFETILTFINMSSSPSSFTVTFYDDDGNAVPLPLVNGDGSVSRLASADITLDGNTSAEVVIANVDADVRSAWSYLSFSSSVAPIAGSAVVRSKDSKGVVINESTQSLSNIQDYDFFAPFDNLEGIQTALVLVNPGQNGANVSISAQDSTGAEIVRDYIKIPAGARTIIVLPTAYSSLANASGKLRVTADTANLSAICYRTSPTNSLSYSPIFNWSGMFR